MKRSNNSSVPGHSVGPTPDPVLGRLLATAFPAEDVLPWDKVERLVASAPAVPATLGNHWLHWRTQGPAVQRQSFRPALALFSLMLVATCAVMFAAPAQSDFVGTIVTTKKPLSWEANGVELAQVRAEARSYFSDLGISNSELYIMVLPREGRDDIAFTMLNVDAEAARAFFNTLTQPDGIPQLAAFEPSYTSVEAHEYPNLLYQTISTVTQRVVGGNTSRDPGELRAEMLKSLKAQGFENIGIEIVTLEDGTVLIEIDATMEIEVKGRSQEALKAVGISPEVLGSDAYADLLAEIGLQP